MSSSRAGPAAGSILIPGASCAAIVEAPRAGLLIDGRDFYRALHAAFRRARRTIWMAGWQFDGNVELLRGEDRGEDPHQLAGLLRALCRARPELEVRILAWDASAVFAFERVPLQRFVFERCGGGQIRYRRDDCHLPAASQHQKLIAIDRSIAFVGGMDVCNSRWDDRAHRADDPLRANRWRTYAPYHDVQCFVTGDAVDVLRGWFIERWDLATGGERLPDDAPRDEVDIDATVEVDAPRVGLARTWPEMNGCPIPPCREIKELHLRAIAAAERLIYIENQYFSCDEIERALVSRMEELDASERTLEIVILLPEKSAGLKERLSIGIYQARILGRLGEVAERTGHRLGVYHAAASGPDGDVPVFIHAKVMAVDDRFLLVSSANLTNRSMSFDSELGVAWEDPVENSSIRGARIELLREHVGLDASESGSVLGPAPGVVDRLDAIARAARHRLRIHRRNQDERPGPILSRFVPDDPPFDPDHIEDMLPEPGVWLDRILRDPIVMLVHGGRHLARRRRPRR